MTHASEWNAAGYARISALQQQMAADALALLTLDGSETVLDVGCGQGQVTAAIAARLPRGRVVGVDPSHDMIAFADAHFVAPNLHFDVGDARTLRFAAGAASAFSPSTLAFSLAISSSRLAAILRTRRSMPPVPAGMRRTTMTFSCGWGGAAGF